MVRPGREGGEAVSLTTQWTLIFFAAAVLAGWVLYNGAWYRGRADGIRYATEQIFPKAKEPEQP